jgi:mono/diheme cytochrome c family protein
MRLLLKRNVWLTAALCASAFFAPGPAIAAADDAVARGEAILQKNCARCHAIGTTGKSTHPQAPPFREVVKRYPVEDLEESLAEGIVSGHADMPEFTFAPDEINAIVAYLNDLKAKTAGK